MREKFVFKILTSIFLYCLTTVSGFLIALKFDVALLGMLAYSKSLIGLFSIFTMVGFTLIYNQYNSEKNFEEYFSILVFYQFILTAVNHIPLYFLLFIFDYNADRMLLLIILITATIGNIISPFITHLSSKMKVFKVDAPKIILSIMENIIKIFIALNVSILPNPLLTLVSVSLVFVIVKLIIFLIISRGEYKFRKLNPVLMKRFLKDTRPIIFITVITLIYTNIQIIILDLSFGHEALAYYIFVQSYIIAILLMISGSIKPLYLSVYSKKFSENKIQELEKITNLIEKYSSIMFLFIIIFTFLNAQFLITLLLPNYLPSLPFLYLLIFIPFLAGINRPYTMLMIPGKKQKINSRFQTIKIIFLLILVIILVPPEFFSIKMMGLGAIGLCLIQLIHWGINTVTYRYLIKKYFGIHSYKKIYIHIIIAINVFFITYYINQYLLSKIFENSILIFLLISLMLFGLYFSELFIIKELKRQDIKFFLSLLKIKKYKESFSEEFS